MTTMAKLTDPRTYAEADRNKNSIIAILLPGFLELDFSDRRPDLRVTHR